jgi:exopolysaccharide production protein ExoZ
LNSIEACRGAAALLVLLHHASAFVQTPAYYDQPVMGGMFDWGFAGVDFFFVVSGFVIFWSNRAALGRPTATRQYLWRRFVRIYPIYWLVTAPIVIGYFVLPIASTGTETEVLSILGSLTLFPTHKFPHLSVAWTLSYEMMFYLLFALLIVNIRAGAAVLVLWQLTTLTWLLADMAGPPVAEFIFNPRNLHFGLGLIAAILVDRTRVRFAPAIALTGVFAFVTIGVAWVMLPAIDSPYWWLSFAGAAALIVLGLAGWEKQGSFAVPAPLLLLGAASYAIYLVHYPAELVVTKAFLAVQSALPVPPLLVFLVSSGIALASGIALHLLVERPVLRRLRDARWGRRRVTPNGREGTDYSP